MFSHHDCACNMQHISWCSLNRQSVVCFRQSAENLADLSQRRFTHILNAAHSKRKGQPEIYDGMNITYMGIEGRDSLDYDMSVNFHASADFIHRALSRGGKTGDGEAARIMQNQNLMLLLDFQAKFWCIVTWESVARPPWFWLT